MRIGSSAAVAGLTAAAFAVLGLLAVQANSKDPGSEYFEKPRPSASASAGGPDGSSGAKDGKGGKHGKDGKDGGKGKTAATPPVPGGSGGGKRVVYSLGQQRVWLVETVKGGKGERVVRSFKVAPSSVSPVPNSYAVQSKAASAEGSDGVQIEHIVRFTAVNGVTIGFSAAQDGSSPKPDPEQRTGGIREKRADGRELWEFTEVGTSVVVVK
jgi:hypothetical protein